MKLKRLKNIILDILFPKLCFGCQKEGEYLCADCQSLLDICNFHHHYKTKNLNDLYFAVPYKGYLIKKLIQQFKYENFVKELAKPLSEIILTHFKLIEKMPDFSDYILIPIPLEKKRQKWRGFNQAEELAKEIKNFLKIPLITDVLIKRKRTLPQVELSEKERKENILNAFFCTRKEMIKNKKILLIDDIYTTGSTMEEAAKVLKEAGAKEVIGLVVARAEVGKDKK